MIRIPIPFSRSRYHILNIGYSNRVYAGKRLIEQQEGSAATARAISTCRRSPPDSGSPSVKPFEPELRRSPPFRPLRSGDSSYLSTASYFVSPSSAGKSMIPEEDIPIRMPIGVNRH